MIYKITAMNLLNHRIGRGRRLNDIKSIFFFFFQIDNSFRRVVHTYNVARSELSGQFEDNSSFKRKGKLIVPVHCIMQMSSDLNIWERKRHKREKHSSLQQPTNINFCYIFAIYKSTKSVEDSGLLCIYVIYGLIE